MTEYDWVDKSYEKYCQAINIEQYYPFKQTQHNNLSVTNTKYYKDFIGHDHTIFILLCYSWAFYDSVFLFAIY